MTDLSAPTLSPLAYVVIGLEIALALAGVALIWRLVFSPAARARARGRPLALTPWPGPVHELLLFIAIVIGGSFFAAAIVGAIGRSLGLRGDAATVCIGAGTQLGMLAAVAFFWARPERGRPVSPPGGPNIFLAGGATFLAALPLVIVTMNLWQFLLESLGAPLEKQDLIGMFANAESPWLIAIMIALAVVFAPLTEELVFRAGFYRYLLTRVRRVLALALTAVLFAGMHANIASFAPLVVLSVSFSLAYERTGKIGVPIVAHALFNLNTLVAVLAGLGEL